MELISIKANATNLSKIIKWSSSKHNEYTKKEVINDILESIKKGCDICKEYGTGSFSELGSLSGRDYYLNIKDGKAIFYSNAEIYKQYILERR